MFVGLFSRVRAFVEFRTRRCSLLTLVLSFLGRGSPVVNGNTRPARAGVAEGQNSDLGSRGPRRLNYQFQVLTCQV